MKLRGKGVDNTNAAKPAAAGGDTSQRSSTGYIFTSVPIQTVV